MTKCIVLGETQIEENKPIEFIKFLGNNWNFRDSMTKPRNYKNIELVVRDYVMDTLTYDIMFAYDKDRNEGCLYIGYWNGGVV